MVGAEAIRNGQFGLLLKAKINQMNSQEWQITQLDELVITLLGDMIQIEGNGMMRFLQERFLADFLENPAQLPVGDAHIAWLALLLWLESKGYQMKVERQATGLYCQSHRFDGDAPDMRLANWIEQF